MESKLIGRVVCFNCKRDTNSLVRVIDGAGKKTDDYVCVGCRAMGFTAPLIANSSRIYPTKEDQSEQELSDKEI